jgi:type VI secretion system protein VasD
MKRSWIMLCCLPWMLGGCAGGTGTSGGNVLEAIGLRKPQPVPEAQQPPRNVVVHLHAAPRLNVDARGQSLALVVRIYKLRQRGAFDQAPFAAFLSAQAERDVLGADLVEVREITLVPGQHLDVNDRLARDTPWLGVVALFHAPAEHGWRAVFAAADAEQAGVTIGLHACALTVGTGALPAGGALRPLSLVHCQ